MGANSACNRICAPGRRGSCCRSLTGPVLMPFVPWSDAQILKLNPTSTTPKCCVHLSIASVKERFLSALITMVTPPRAKIYGCCFCQIRPAFLWFGPLLRSGWWLLSTGAQRLAWTCNEPSDVAISRWHGLTQSHLAAPGCWPWASRESISQVRNASPGCRHGACPEFNEETETEEMHGRNSRGLALGFQKAPSALHGGNSRGLALGFQKAPSALHLRTSKIQMEECSRGQTITLITDKAVGKICLWLAGKQTHFSLDLPHHCISWTTTGHPQSRDSQHALCSQNIDFLPAGRGPRRRSKEVRSAWLFLPNHYEQNLFF